MDIYNLVAAHIHARAGTALMSPRAEDRYYANQIAPPRLGPGLFGSLAMMAGVILILCIYLI